MIWELQNSYSVYWWKYLKEENVEKDLCYSSGFRGGHSSQMPIFIDI